jgi:hypothetical protein
VIENALKGQPDLAADPVLRQRRQELAAEAQVTLAAIRALAAPGGPDPLTDPDTLARAVTVGILDAPQLKNNRFGRGIMQTRILSGACQAVDSTGNPLTEAARIANLANT